MIIYPVEAFARMILSVVAALAVRRDAGAPRAAVIAADAAALLTIGGLLFTTKAAPIMLSVCHLGNDPAALQRAFDGFDFWGRLRGLCQVSAYVASFWAFVAFCRAGNCSHHDQVTH
jgi:hypothetical protein